MLSPEYLLKVSEGAESIAEELHNDILNRIAERMMVRIGRGEKKILTGTDRWQIETLQDAGFLLEEIQKEISDRTKQQEKEIKAAMEEAGIRALSYDDGIYRDAGLSPVSLPQSPRLVRLMQRNFEATVGEWKNFTRTTADAAQQAYIKACDKAYHLVSSGAISYTQAVREAIDDIVNDGVTVTYPSGHTDTIETATLRAVRTGISQATGEIQITRMEEMDWDIILVSAHLGARDKGNIPENHFLWQGKFYSRTGRDTRFPDFKSYTGYGTVIGLCGANCRHSFGPGDGENNPFENFDSKENHEAYELSQKQRALERRIRKTKREVMLLKTARDNAEDESLKAELDLNYQKKAVLLQKQNQAYNTFCEENGLKRLQDRLAIAKWDRSQAASASSAAKRFSEHTNENIYQMFQNNNQYRKVGGEFDIASALSDYKDFLTSVPEKNRIYLEQSVNAVEYMSKKLNTASFGYSESADAIYYDPSKAEFWDYEFAVSNTHELAHRIDTFFVESPKDGAFSSAIHNAKNIIDVNPKQFVEYCKDNDRTGFLSDTLDAISAGKYNFRIGHDETYWVQKGNAEKEIFANLFSMETFNDIDKLKYFQKHFPEIMEAYNKFL